MMIEMLEKDNKLPHFELTGSILIRFFKFFHPSYH
jgi:hypothetical protein